MTARTVKLIVVVCVYTMSLVALPSSSLAAQPAPAWSAVVVSGPTDLPPATGAQPGVGKIAIYPINVGGAPSSGEITITDVLPPHVKTSGTPSDPNGVWSCSEGSGQTTITCTTNESAPPGLGPKTFGALFITSPIRIPVHIETTVPERTMNEVTLSGGSAASPATVDQHVVISPTPASPGVETLTASVYDSEGKLETQAAAHPNAITTAVMVNTVTNPQGEIVPAGELKNVEVKLPPGLSGNPQAVPKCPSNGEIQSCSAYPETVLGVAAPIVGDEFAPESWASDIWNLKPEFQTPAEFGFMGLILPVYLNSSVRSDGDFGVTVSAPDVLQELQVWGSIVTFWGKPNEASHDEERCGYLYIDAECKSTTAPNVPFLTNPTDCQKQAVEPAVMSAEVSFWQNLDEFSAPLSTAMAPVTGCDRVPFHPSLHVQLTEHTAAEPSGVVTELHMPQVDSEAGLAEANVQKAVVTLPKGMVISPSAASGLSACSPSQIGLTSDSPVKFNIAAPSCPDSSQLGTVKIDTPLLLTPLEGYIYLAEQDNNPFHSLIAIYLSAYDPATAIRVKVAGRVELDQRTGQITAVFDELPQLPFGNVRLAFKQGPRAPLQAPTACGNFTTTSDITPWSAAGPGPSGETIPGIADAMSTDQFTVEGCDGSVFSPSFVAGTVNNQAGAYSPFSMTLSREDDQEQTIGGLSISLPPGLSGMLSNVPLCAEPQAGEGSCPISSQIGHVTAVFGPGPHPLTVPEPGKPADPVYLTGPYKGAPFGLAVVVPAEAGPFNLGRVVVRAKVEVNPITAQVTVSSDPLPTILRGVPTDVRTVNVVIDRDGFTFNPTNCGSMTIGGSVSSTEGSTRPLSDHFQAANCAGLTFKPQFKASTSGKTSRAKGASLDVKLTYPKAAFGSQADIAKVKVDLPKQLPSRLTTLQKACPAGVFDQNPAACPSDSRVGSATASTPIIPVPLSGPAYFVSYGGAKFPELVVVLSGYGVTVQLHGETFISKAGITSSTFRQVPDVPVASFELKLPEGRYSALAANGNLCTSKLSMPTAFTAQNGLTLKQSTAIAVTGCPKHKAKKATRKAKGKTNTKKGSKK